MLRLNEIFTSLQGEADGYGEQGQITTFVRLQGCNLNCAWCDTPGARKDGVEGVTYEEVLAKIKTKKVTITGGEPLLQLTEVAKLVNELATLNHRTTIETNGSLRIPGSYCKFARAAGTLRYVVDYKLGSSGVQYGTMQLETFSNLHSYDVVKFVIKTVEDYHEAREIYAKLGTPAKKVFSPVMAKITLACRTEYPPNFLAKHMLTDKLEGVTLSLQIHKLLSLQ